MSSRSSKGGSRQVPDFLLTINYALCHGPVDTLNRVRIGEKVVYRGAEPTRADILIEKPDLFGGDDAEGGCVGTMEYYPGTDDQLASAELAQRWGAASPNDAPGYRGICHFLFRGLSEGLGFKWRANNPYMPSPDFSVTRIPGPGSWETNAIWPIKEITDGAPVVWDPADVVEVEDGDNDTMRVVPDANGAWIIYETLTNPDWGKGEPENLINLASFTAAASTLKAENFGLSLIWNAQETIDSFIQEILDHIQAVLFLDPATGQWTLRLLRGDYDPETLPVLDPSNSDAHDRKRRAWGETVNEIVVSYTDPATEKPATVSAYDQGNIAIQRGVISETRDYYGIRNPFLAQIIAERDVRAAAYPLFSGRVTVDRTQWKVRPGNVYRFNWPEDGIDNMVIRVMAVDYGKPDDRQITLQIVEDIFAIEQTQYSAPARTEWVEPDKTPQDLPRAIALTPPLPALVLAGESPSDIDAGWPGLSAIILADDPGNRPTSIDVYSDATDRTGQTSVQNTGQIAPTNSGTVATALAEEASSVLPASVFRAIRRAEVEPGDLFMIGMSEADSEIVMLDTFDAVADEWTVARGVWDTVPRAWPAGSVLWYLQLAGTEGDPTARASGETATYQLTPRTISGTLPLADATPFDATFTDRPFAPFRPANTQLDGAGFGELVLTETPTTVTASWENRNRLFEDQVVVRWDQGNVAPETGQTTVLVVYDQYGDVFTTISDLSGTSYDMVRADFPVSGLGEVAFFSERDGFISEWAARRSFNMPATGLVRGWGIGWGRDYGH